MAAIEVAADAGVARVVLDRPPLNIVDLTTARELADALEELLGRTDLNAVLLSGRGKAFCAGVDVRDHLPDRGEEMLREFHRVCRMLLELETPVVAAVQGPALGGGCELTLVCDIVIASEKATFGQPEIKLGVMPPLAAVALPRLVAPHLASEMVLTGRILNAQEALAAGLVNYVVSAEKFDERVEATLAQLRALSPTTLRLAKRAMRFARRRPDIVDVEAAERLYVHQLMNTPDAIEGLQAFLDKRAPAWGRE